MPRIERERSSSGIYHIMSRGINRQQIFEDDDDYLLLLDCLRRYQATCEYRLHAYCLLGNHYHLLIEVKDDSLAEVLRRVGTRFVYWYNWKHQRSGHLFQDRFKSEPVETDAYFLTVLRYIHRNPVKAKLCRDPADYRYCSYGAYLGNGDDLVCTSLALGMISVEDFVRFHHEDNDDECLDLKAANRLTDAEALALIKDTAGIKDPSTLQVLGIPERDDALRKLKATVLSIRQISRLTGISKKVVEKA